MDSNEKIIRFKMILFGDGGVGKTSLVERFIYDRFEENYISTLGYNVYEKRISYENAVTISLIIWDIAGQEKYEGLRMKYAEGASNAFLVYNIADRNSFINIRKWKQDLDAYSGLIPLALIGNKMDLESERQVSREEGENLAAEIGALVFLETSAKTGNEIENAFHQIAFKSYQALFTKVPP
jgi:small GTP-binding protein